MHGVTGIEVLHSEDPRGPSEECLRNSLKIIIYIGNDIEFDLNIFPEDMTSPIPLEIRREGEKE